MSWKQEMGEGSEEHKLPAAARGRRRPSERLAEGRKRRGRKGGSKRGHDKQPQRCLAAMRTRELPTGLLMDKAPRATTLARARRATTGVPHGPELPSCSIVNISEKVLKPVPGRSGSSIDDPRRCRRERQPWALQAGPRQLQASPGWFSHCTGMSYPRTDAARSSTPVGPLFSLPVHPISQYCTQPARSVRNATCGLLSRRAGRVRPSVSPSPCLTREHAAPAGGLGSQRTGDLYPLLLLLKLGLRVLGVVHLPLAQGDDILQAAQSTRHQHPCPASTGQTLQGWPGKGCRRVVGCTPGWPAWARHSSLTWIWQ